MADDGETRGRLRAARWRLLQAKDPRTVRRRFGRFHTQALAWKVLELAEPVGAALAQLLPAFGNGRLPRTNNAVERLFRAFIRFARARNGLGSPASARRKIQLFMLGVVVERVARVAAQGQLPPSPALERFQQPALYQMWTQPAMRMLQHHLCRPRAERQAAEVA